MKRSFWAILALVIVMGISSCNSGALVFNNKIVEVQKNLEPRIVDFGNRVQQLGEIDDIKIVAPQAKQLQEDLGKGIEKIKAVEAPKNGEEFKRSLIAQFEFMKKYCGQIIKLGEEGTTQEEKIAIATDLMNVETEATKFDEDVRAKQMAFAKANGFKLENK